MGAVLGSRLGERVLGPMLRPSLTRRVLLALLVAFGLCFAVLVGIDWVAMRLGGPEVLALPKAVRGMVVSLPAESPEQAVAVVRAMEQQINRSRDELNVGLGKVLFRLERLPREESAAASLSTLAASEPSPLYQSAALQGQALPASAPADARLSLHGRPYWMAAHDAPPWRLSALEPVPGDGDALRWLSADLVGSFLIALPVLLLPLWLAVRRGLAPLRGFVARVKERQPDDASPLGLDLRYAELTPLATAFESLLARTRASIERERALVHDAAHEMRTPLAVMTAQAHVLAASTDPAQRLQARAALEHAVARASHLVHQLLTLARLDADLPPAPQALDVVALARQILATAAPRAAERGIEVSLDSPEQLAAWLEPAALHSVIENLLNNAIHYGRDGGRVEVALWVKPAPLVDAAGSARPDGAVQPLQPTLHLSLADDGPGIPPEERSRLFERFQRGRGVRATGSGLGLAIVRQAVARLGGELQAGPGLDGRGLGWALRLPAGQATGATATMLATAPERPRASPPAA